MKGRSRARGWALQALYAWEARGAEDDRLIPVLHELYENLNVSAQNRLYADALVRLVSRNLEQIDSLLKENLTNWTLARLSVIDRNVLRMGVAEMLFVDDVPPSLTVREMMAIAEKYGTESSGRFVHGVLEAMARALEPKAAERR